ncbi:Pre-rRNA-processing protein ESF2 [Coniochaeta hoffmannii]|uniref:18S rRNA factor 2 n=1 Tax=Coniochaeta hoffmannii TaxID=91930 RepID=A0AA38S0B5_9PEZI|nr:Pre-rRNA-processing protein ESF2 [Coniochaeta hoffmannii]
MAPEKRNHFLDADESDEDVGRDYNSDDDLQKGGRSAKRRRVGDDSDDEAQSDADYDSADEGSDDPKDGAQGDGDQQRDGAQDKNKKETKESKKRAELPNVSKPLTKKNLVATEAAIKKSGVVYLSRIPPFMKPQKLRSLLEPYGKINRIFLSPEDPAAHTRRVKSGGNKKRSFVDGWVEFVNKKEAKAVCELLNAQTIGGKKGSYYRDDIWNLLYLKGFKWHNLTEQIAAENAERTSRMRAEISKTTKENKEFVRNVERAKMLDGIEAKNAAKKERREQGKGNAEEEAQAEKGADKPGKERKRTFAQIPLAKKKSASETQPDQVQRVLSSIF